MIKKVLTSLIIGDALGSAVDGMTRGHIRSHFKTIGDYIDPEPALKNKIEQWRKPGLYSSMTQLALIMAMACPRRGPCVEAFQRAVASSPEIAGSDYGIFRYPGAVEREFITRMKDPARPRQMTEQPCSRIIPAITFLSFRSNPDPDHILDVIAAVRLFTHDASTLAAALVYSSLLRAMTAGGDTATGPLGASIEAAKRTAATVESTTAAIFAQGVNPGTLTKELRALMETLMETATAETLKSAEDIIITRVNRKLKTPVTRATVNLPAALFPYALAVSSPARAASTPLAEAVSAGGSTAALAAMTGAVGACFHDADIHPDSFIMNLVNRKKVLALVDALCCGAVTRDILEEFMRSEASLTAKEQEELNARLKHGRKKPGKAPFSQAEREKELARHAVESWTKYDKARWRKERQRHDKSDE